MHLSTARHRLLRRRNQLAAKVAALRNRGAVAPFLSGRVTVLERERIEGVIVTKEPTPLQVAIYLNETQVTTTPSVPAGQPEQGDGHVQRFRFTLLDLWRFARRADRMTVRVEGQPIPLGERGMVYHPPRDGAESIRRLRQRLNAGEVFGQSGRLQRSRSDDDHWQDQVLRLYDAVSSLVREQFGYQPFLYNGTLLGAVREQGFISHDLDFDAAYISRHNSGAAAARELFDIADALITAGFQVIPKFSCIAVRDEVSGSAQIDLFHLYITKRSPQGRRVAFPFGTVSTGAITPEQFGEIVERDFAGRTVAVPANSEAVVAHIYGPHWAIPNPGFNWIADRGARDVGRLNLNRQDLLYWRSFFAHERRFAAERQQPSTFVQAVLEWPDRPRLVLDLGCGDGRDSVRLGEAGHRVIGVDRCEAALEQARVRTGDSNGNPEFRNCDFTDAETLGRLIAEARGGRPDTPILFYARFLLHGLPEATQRTLLQTLTEHGRPGDWFVAESRTDQDQARRKAFFGTTRRGQPTSELLAELIDTYRWSVLDSEEGTGLAPLGPEDPHLVRVLAVRPSAEVGLRVQPTPS